ncbi:MAG: PQQ-dependent sugar dehydrogenase [Archaeoglobaceae archaeon]
MKKAIIVWGVLLLAILFIGCADQEEQPTPTPTSTTTPEQTPTTTPTPTGTPTPTSPTEEFDEVSLNMVADGLTAPVSMAYPEDGDRLFIVDQIGKVWVMDNGEIGDDPFLDISDKIVGLNQGYDERGLMDIAFHPNYGENGRVYVYYSAPLREEAPDDWDHTSHLSEFTVSENGEVDTNSESILLRVDEPQSNHNGGQLLFGPDGYLYISLGDGGGAYDQGIGHPPGGNAQNLTTLLGSILRIDVDGGNPYGVPQDNPFVGEEGRDEIYAYGFRNPYRMSMDSSGRLFVADAGQELFEEVSIVEEGMNYGWNLKEGEHYFDPDNPENPPETGPDEGPYGRDLVDPIIEYRHPESGVSVVVGGHVYEGDALTSYQGAYIFGDWSFSFSQPEGKLFFATPEDWELKDLPLKDRTDGEIEEFILGFGEDSQGEVYVLTSGTSGPTGDTGKVYKIVPEDMQQERQPSLNVSDQMMEYDQVNIDSVYFDEPGYVVVHRDDNGSPGAVIGHSDLISGEMQDLMVNVSGDITPTVYPMLHYDDGDGVYDFPGNDSPVSVDGQVVVKSITLSKKVMIQGFAFSPSSITVPAGMEVVWENQDGTTHTVTSRDGVFDSGNIADGETYSYTFDEAGTYEYYCTIHPSMEGVVEVT